MFYHPGLHQEQLTPLASAPHHLHEALWRLQGAMAGHVPMSLLTPTWEAAGAEEGLCLFPWEPQTTSTSSSSCQTFAWP